MRAETTDFLFRSLAGTSLFPVLLQSSMNSTATNISLKRKCAWSATSENAPGALASLNRRLTHRGAFPPRRTSVNLVASAVGVAQLVERRTVAPKVAGSNPVSHPILNLVYPPEALSSTHFRTS